MEISFFRGTLCFADWRAWAAAGVGVGWGLGTAAVKLIVSLLCDAE